MSAWLAVSYICGTHLQVQLPNTLLSSTFRPWTDRPLRRGCLRFYEPLLLKNVRKLKFRIRLHPSFLRAAENLLLPMLERRALRNAPIVPHLRQMTLLELNPSARL